MKILHVSTLSFADPRYYRSLELTLCRSLVRLGHKVNLVTSNRPPKWQMLERSILPSMEVIDGVTIRRLPCGPELGNAATIPSLLGEIMKLDWDLVHAHEVVAPGSFYSALASRIKNKPLIVTQHDYAYGNVHGARLFIQMFSDNTYGRFVARGASTMIAISSQTGKFLERMGASKSKICIIPNSVDTTTYSPNRNETLRKTLGIDGPVVLFVGRLIKRKGVDVLLRAFHRAASSTPTASLIIVGSGPEEQRLRELQAELSLQNVFFIDRVAREEMPQIYASSDVFVLPALYYEIFGNVVLEAMATGLPTICTKVGGMIDIVEDSRTGFQVDPGDEEELSDRLCQLMTDEALRLRMSGQARQLAVQKYDDSVIARSIERIYEHAKVS